jgi:hypothetical protein
MAITSDHNLYPGVNAHLNSYLQLPNSEDSWETFHTDYITLLRITLDKTLPHGYYAASEKSLQIGEYEAKFVEPIRKQRTFSDVMVLRQHQLPTSTVSSSALQTMSPAFTLPLPETIDDEDKLSSITVFQANLRSTRGQPVTRIELLSPSNKPGQSHHEQYATKRLAVLKAGLRLVEIDYLDMYPPIRTALPSYRAHEPGAQPYNILVSDPRPNFEDGITSVYPIGILDPIPRIAVPLDGSDNIEVDFGTVYNDLFSSSRLFQMIADYANDPPAFDRFTPEDQDAIRALLTGIRSQHTIDT